MKRWRVRGNDVAPEGLWFVVDFLRRMRRSARIYGPDKVALLWAIDAVNELPKIPETGFFELSCEGLNNVTIGINSRQMSADVDGQYILQVESERYHEEGLDSDLHGMLSDWGPFCFDDIHVDADNTAQTALKIDVATDSSLLAEATADIAARAYPRVGLPDRTGVYLEATMDRLVVGVAGEGFRLSKLLRATPRTEGATFVSGKELVEVLKTHGPGTSVIEEHTNYISVTVGEAARIISKCPSLAWSQFSVDQGTRKDVDIADLLSGKGLPTPPPPALSSLLTERDGAAKLVVGDHRFAVESSSGLVVCFDITD